MKRATLKEEIEYPEAAPIVEALGRLGIKISYKDAHDAWVKYSDTMAAGWMCLPDSDGGILAEINHYLDIADEPEPCKRCNDPYSYSRHTCEEYKDNY